MLDKLALNMQQHEIARRRSNEHPVGLISLGYIRAARLAAQHARCVAWRVSPLTKKVAARA